MPVIQISGDRRGVGKTSLAGALLARRISAGKSGGYYKPFTTWDVQDPDVAFVENSLLNAPTAPTAPTAATITPPVRLPDSAGPSHAGSLAEQVGDFPAPPDVADTLIVEGPDLVSPSGEPWSLPGEVANRLGAQVLLVLGFSNQLSAANTIDSVEQFGSRLLGVVVNGVTSYRSRQTTEGFLAELQAAGAPTLGLLPEDRGMLAVSVGQIAEHLGGHWVQDPEDTSVLIERFLIGGNIMDSGATYFGRYANQAVITRAERPDIQLASLMEDTRCLVLTGTGEPTDYIKAEAMQRDVPLIRVERDTLSTVEALAGLLDKATAHSAWKINRFAGLLDRRLDMSSLEALL